jgi:hypothetical protein
LLEIINQQGAQVIALQNQVQNQQAVIASLIVKLGLKSVRVTKAERKLVEQILAINWNELKDGTLIVTVTKEKGQK